MRLSGTHKHTHYIIQILFVFIVHIISVCYFHMPLRNPTDVWAEHKRKLEAKAAVAIAADRAKAKRTCIELISDDEPPRSMHEM